MEYMKWLKIFQKALDEMMLKCINDNIEHSLICDKLIAFQFWLNSEIVPKYTLDYSKKYPAKYFVLGYYTNNLLSAHTSIKAIESGMYQQSMVHMRVILETILKTFYLTIYPNNAVYVHAHDLVKTILKQDRQQTDERLQEFLTNSEQMYGKHSVDEIKNEIKKNKYNFHFYVQELYDEERGNAMDEQYGVLSDSSHGNIMNMAWNDQSLWQYNPKMANVGFEYIQSLLFHNLVVGIEAHKNVITENNFVECKQFLQEMKPKLAPKGLMYNSVYPNNPSINSWEPVFRENNG